MPLHAKASKSMRLQIHRSAVTARCQLPYNDAKDHHLGLLLAKIRLVGGPCWRHSNGRPIEWSEALRGYARWWIVPKESGKKLLWAWIFLLNGWRPCAWYAEQETFYALRGGFWCKDRRSTLRHSAVYSIRCLRYGAKLVVPENSGCLNDLIWFNLFGLGILWAKHSM